MDASVAAPTAGGTRNRLHWLRGKLRTRTSRALLGTIAGNAVGFLLPFAVTGHFGFGRLTDAYFFGLGLAIFGTVLSATVIEANALPLMTSAKLGGSERLRRAIGRVSVQSVGGVLAAYAPVAVVGSLILSGRHAWPADLRSAAIQITAILTLLVAIVGATSVLAAVGYAFGDFLWPTATQSFRSIAPMVGLIFIGRGVGSLATLAWLMVAGEVLRGLVLGRKVLGLLRQTGPGDLAVSRPLPSVWRAGGPHAIAMIGVNLMPVVDRIVASKLRAGGSVTLLDLGEKILYVPLLGVTYSVILVAGADWAESSVLDPERLRPQFVRLARRVVYLALALAAACTLLAFGAHALRPGSISGVPSGKLAVIVACFMLGLPAASLTNVGSRLFTALGRTRALPVIALLLLVADVLFDLVGARLWGTYGIALATTAVRFLSAPVYVLAAFAAIRSFKSSHGAT